ncbi:hypothetical protein SCLCIDRAFT_28641 [Scleroderma citrinum Foug A]|uniref:Uncharacterized protein n=1 Tax=Scleroderma citrinum Foug A TaxID=1036808 RepID=A0A0C3DAC5_9AGAM|nr:hypothetical protein SCLCIDRAFT_28641 [Scleroderma citrinum Foug A]
MVKIPELTEDRQNWKIYHAKFLEVAATYDCLEVLAGRPYEGEDWDGCNALLCCTFMESVPPSIYFKIRCRTAYENFKYLVKRFRDNEPIPRANEFQCTGTAAAAEMPENYPTSANAATEQHVKAKLDEDDLTTTKALTQGTEDINVRNVRHIQDPRTSSEASVKGISTECTEMTSVILKSTPHEMQTKPHSSLPLTPRPPIEGEPRRCKQEVAESIVMAGRTNGTVEKAKPQIKDVDRTAMLGVDLAMAACGVNKGDEMECKPQFTYGLPLEGEWTLYASSEARHLKGCANALNATPECMHSSSVSKETEDTKGVKSEGCREGMSEQESIDEVDGSTGCGIRPVGTPSELTEFVAVSIKLEASDDDGIPCVRLGGMWMWLGDVNGPGYRMHGLSNQSDDSGCQTDGLKGQMDGSRMRTDTLSVSNNAETDVVSHGDGAGTYLVARDMKCDVMETDGVETCADAPIGCGDVQNVKMDPNIPEIKMKIVSSSRNGSKTRDSPYTAEIKTFKHSRCWRKVSIEGVDVKSAGGWMTMDFEGKGAGNSDGNRDGDGEGKDGMMSSGHVNSD